MHSDPNDIGKSNNTIYTVCDSDNKKAMHIHVRIALACLLPLLENSQIQTVMKEEWM